MKTIKSKIMSAIILTVVISLMVLGSVSVILTQRATNAALSQTMIQTAIIAGERIDKEIEAYKNIAVETGMIKELADKYISPVYKESVIKRKAEQYGLVRGNILGADGISLLDKNNYSDRIYFQEAMKGNSYVSDPLVSKVTGELSVIVAAPIWEGGVFNTQVVGVVYFVPQETFLNDIVNSIHISTNGAAYIINKSGTTIAHKDMERVMNGENVFELAKTDFSFDRLASIHQAMTEGNSDFSSYNMGGMEKFIAY
ncbi:MAG: cache domain-containing protein, partial [Angelakisella sp.]